MLSAILQTARDALKDLPMSDLVRERLALALDQAAISDRKVDEHQAQVGKLEAKIEIIEFERDKYRKDYEMIQAKYSEQVVIHKGAEFRRGLRTGNTWQAFCPRCHCPAVGRDMEHYIHCSDDKCKWVSEIRKHLLKNEFPEIEKKANG
jgi:hypothetical protein